MVSSIRKLLSLSVLQKGRCAKEQMPKIALVFPKVRGDQRERHRHAHAGVDSSTQRMSDRPIIHG